MSTHVQASSNMSHFLSVHSGLTLWGSIYLKAHAHLHNVKYETQHMRIHWTCMRILVYMHLAYHSHCQGLTNEPFSVPNLKNTHL